VQCTALINATKYNYQLIITISVTYGTYQCIILIYIIVIVHMLMYDASSIIPNVRLASVQL